MKGKFLTRLHIKLTTYGCIIAFIITTFVPASFADSVFTGHITYTFSTENSNTQEGKQAYARIKIAMDSALYYYNTYTSLKKPLVIRYNPSVPSAEANFDGLISFGQGKAYQVTCTAMHEISHTIGVGTTNEWTKLMVNGVFTGKNATRKLQEIFGTTDSVVHGDKPPKKRLEHFWPFGLNYASEVKSTQDLINHCLVVNEIYKDLFPTGAIAFSHQQQLPPLSIAIHPNMSFTAFVASPCRIETAIFTLAGEKVGNYSQKFEHSGEYTINLPRSHLSSGRYIYRIVAGERATVSFMMVLH